MPSPKTFVYANEQRTTSSVYLIMGFEDDTEVMRPDGEEISCDELHITYSKAYAAEPWHVIQATIVGNRVRLDRSRMPNTRQRYPFITDPRRRGADFCDMPRWVADLVVKHWPS